jgi:hypothetical protein
MRAAHEEGSPMHLSHRLAGWGVFLVLLGASPARPAGRPHGGHGLPRGVYWPYLMIGLGVVLIVATRRGRGAGH